MSLTDESMVMPVAPYYSNGNNGCGNGWGGDWAWIILLLLIGWGNNGWGNGGFGGGANGVLTRGDLCMDMNFNDLQNAVRSGVAENNSNFRSVDNAVCTLGYQNAQLINGIQMQIANGFGTLDTSLCQIGNNIAQTQNAIQSQLAQCCCDTRQAIAETNYNLATQACQTRQTINDAVRSLHDEIVANRIEDKNAQIQAQAQQIFALQLQASQAQQTNDIVNTVRPCPIPAFVTCNPWGSNNCGCGQF